MNDTPTPRTDDMIWSHLNRYGYSEDNFFDDIKKLETELTAVTEQRDRLAEALNMYAWPCSDQELSHYCCSASPSFSVEAQREMKRRKALQFLPTNAQAMASADEKTPPKETTL